MNQRRGVSYIHAAVFWVIGHSTVSYPPRATPAVEFTQKGTDRLSEFAELILNIANPLQFLNHEDRGAVAHLDEVHLDMLKH